MIRNRDGRSRMYGEQVGPRHEDSICGFVRPRLHLAVNCFCHMRSDCRLHARVSHHETIYLGKGV
jgi:hypothetical protein